MDFADPLPIQAPCSRRPASVKVSKFLTRDSWVLCLVVTDHKILTFSNASICYKSPSEIVRLNMLLYKRKPPTTEGTLPQSHSLIRNQTRSKPKSQRERNIWPD